MNDKEMMLDVLHRLKRDTETAIGLIENDSIRDNENPYFTIPEPYTLRIGDFLITDEKVKFIGNAGTYHCSKLTI